MAATRLSSQGDGIWPPQATLDEKDADFVASFNQFLRSMMCDETAPTSHPMFREMVPRRQSLRLANVYKLVHEKVRFVSLLKQQGAEYFGQSRSLCDFIETNRQRNLVILFFTLINCRTRNERETAQLNRDYFLRLLSTRPAPDSTTIYLAVDLDVRDGRTTHICRYVGGVCVSHDELERSLLKDSEGPRLACSINGYLPVNSRPQVFPLMVSCPCRPSKSDRYAWQCLNCGKQIKVDLKGTLYCECGMACADDFKMICNSSLHRGELKGFWPGLLESLLVDRRLVPKQLNILVLNASRVEQTKWMNACLNRLAYPSLREVVQTESRVVAPDSSANVDSRSIHFYSMVTLTLRVRCASPPDFPLTEEEEESFFDRLSTLGELNSICVIMTPEETSADCLKFLSKFSREAAKNVAFCITDFSARLPSPGTATALKQTLTKCLNVTKAPAICYLDTSPLDCDCVNYPGFELAELKWAKQTAMIESFFHTISESKPLKCNSLREWRDARCAVDLLYPHLQRALFTENRFLSMPATSEEEEMAFDEGRSTPRAEVRQRMRQLRICEAEKLKEVQQVFNNFINKCALIDDNCVRALHTDNSVTPENITECIKLLVALPIHGNTIRRVVGG